MVDELKGLFGGGESDPRAARGADREARREARQERRAARLQDDPNMQRRAQDYIHRYTTGDPSEGYDPNEAMQNFQYVQQHASPEQMQRAMQQTVQNMNPNQRAAFEQMLEQRRAGQGMVQIDRTGGQPTGAGGGGLFDMIGGLLGGGGSAGGGGLLGGLLGGGGDTTQTHRTQRSADPTDAAGGVGDILSNPLAKVVLGGVAAYAMKEMMDQNR